MAQLIDLGKLRFEFKGDYNGSTEYESNDVVRYGGNLYTYTNVTKTTGNEPTDTSYWALMLEGFNFRGEWDDEQSYIISDVVSYGGKVYIANEDNTDIAPGATLTPPAINPWAQLVDGIQYESTFSPATSYQKGDVVKYGGSVYIAKVDTIGAQPSDSSRWDILVSGVSYEGEYSSSTEYKVGDLVTYGGKVYIATVEHTNQVPTNISYWDLFVDGIQYEGEYDSGTTYQVGDVVTFGGIVYICTTTSNGNAPSNTSFWDILIEGISYKGAYSSLTQYNKNDIVSYDGGTWIAVQSTIANDPADPSAFWDIVAQGTFPSFVGSEGYFLSNNGSAVVWVQDVSVNDLSVDGSIYVGSGAEDFETNRSLTNAIGVFRFNTGTEDEEFAQLAVNNSDPTSSSDLILYPNNGHNDYGWLSVGVTGSDFADPLYPLTVNNDAYIFYDAPLQSTYSITNKELVDNVATLTLNATPENNEVYPGAIVDVSDVDATFDGRYSVTAVDLANNKFSYSVTASNVSSTAVSPSGTAAFNDVQQGGNLVFATGDSGLDNKIIFAAGGFASGNTQMEITPDVNVHIEIPTPSTDPTTGALTVVGGVGIQGDMNIQGNVDIVGEISFGGSGTTVTTQNLAVSDPVIFAGSNNLADSFDLGLVGEYAEDVVDQVTSVENKSLTSNIATLTTTTSHGYSIGDVVVVSNVDSTFNGTYVITGVPTSVTFTYSKTAANVSSTAVSPTGTATVTHERRWAGVVRDVSDSGKIKFFRGLAEKPTNTVDFANAGLSFAPIVAGSAEFSSVASTNITTSGGTLNLGGTVNISSSADFTGANVTLGSGTWSGTPTFSGDIVFSGSPSFTGTPTFTGGIRVQEMIEDISDVTQSSNSVTLDYTNGNIFNVTNNFSSATSTINITNAPLVDGRIFTINVFYNQGSTASVPTTLNINGSAATIRWPNNTAPTGTANKIDIFSFTLIRRASSWTVLGAGNLNY